MKKQEQKQINDYVVANYKTFDQHYTFWRCNNTVKPKQLRSCQAVVIETDAYYVLKSYSTIVAVIDKFSLEMFDFLRYVYGYTATSAQHITKFANDYAHSSRYTYRPV